MNKSIKTNETRALIIRKQVDTDFGTYYAMWDGSQWCWNVDGKWIAMNRLVITPTEWRIPESPSAKFLDWLYIMGDSFHWKPLDESLAFNTFDSYQNALRIWKDRHLFFKQRRTQLKNQKRELTTIIERKSEEETVMA